MDDLRVPPFLETSIFYYDVTMLWTDCLDKLVRVAGCFCISGEVAGISERPGDNLDLYMDLFIYR